MRLCQSTKVVSIVRAGAVTDGIKQTIRCQESPQGLATAAMRRTAAVLLNEAGMAGFGKSSRSGADRETTRAGRNATLCSSKLDQLFSAQERCEERGGELVRGLDLFLAHD